MKKKKRKKQAVSWQNDCLLCLIPWQEKQGKNTWDPPPQTEHLVPKVGMPLREKGTIVPNPRPEPCLSDFACRGKQAIKEIALISSQSKWLHFQQRMENSQHSQGDCDKRQLGEEQQIHLRYREIYRPGSWLRKGGEQWGFSWGQNKFQSLTSDTIPSKEPQIWLVFGAIYAAGHCWKQ